MLDSQADTSLSDFSLGELAERHPAKVEPASFAAGMPELVAQRAERFAHRRHRLHEFQAQLSEQLHRARSEQNAVIRRLGIVIGAHHCLLELGEAGEVVPSQDITPVPWTHSWFLGLTNLRGHLIGVVDMAAWLGLPPTLMDRDCRVVALAPALGMQCGLLVSKVTGLHDLRSLQPVSEQSSPELLSAWSSETFVDKSGRHWTGLALTKLMRDPRFVQAAQPGTYPSVATERPLSLDNSLPPD